MTAKVAPSVWQSASASNQLFPTSLTAYSWPFRLSVSIQYKPAGVHIAYGKQYAWCYAADVIMCKTSLNSMRKRVKFAKTVVLEITQVKSKIVFTSIVSKFSILFLFWDKLLDFKRATCCACHDITERTTCITIAWARVEIKSIFANTVQARVRAAFIL